MSAVLRIYDPAECDERGVPLAWDRCGACAGAGRAYLRDGAERPPWVAAVLPDVGEPVNGYCGTCDGRGSLKAAALYRKRDHQMIALANGRDRRAPMIRRENEPTRCEDCGHPMSDGTWEGSLNHEQTEAGKFAYGLAVICKRPDERHFGGVGVHYSRCDEGCRHGGPIKERGAAGGTFDVRSAGVHVRDRLPEYADTVEASWRPVDVRTLGWPHDLRVERLAVLCLRCFSTTKGKR